ncbi:hypothetical protein [Microbacterium sp. P04]|uniref:hypothetical protein n=1 Tax=Microbacterium sp. P04 TaxID=3366947 RepID=UPI0037467EA5
MTSRIPATVVAVSLCAIALAGCGASTASPPTPTVTVTATATATVTATPASSPQPAVVERSAADALTAWDAWLVCWGATYGQYHDTSTVFPFSPDSPSGGDSITDKGDGTFEVLVAFANSSGQGNGAESICIAGGTVGNPSVELQGGRDFG